MTTTDKRPRRTTKTAKNTKPPAGIKADTKADTITPENGAGESARPEAGSGAAVASAAEGGSIKSISVTVTSRHYEDRHASIAKAAYFRSEMRGFAPGHEVEDWLAAEEEVDQRLLGEGRAS
jgi:hypothetical protein